MEAANHSSTTPLFHCRVPLRHKHRQTFARAAGFQELRHRQFMAAVAAITQRGDEFRRAVGQNDVALEHNGIAGKVHRFFRHNIDQFLHVLADGALAVFVKGRRKPNGRAIGQRTKASIEMVKTRIDKFD